MIFPRCMFVFTVAVLGNVIISVFVTQEKFSLKGITEKSVHV